MSDEPHVDAEGARQGAERRGRRVCLAALDATDLRLIDSGLLGELLLGEVHRPPLRRELPRQREVEAKRLELF